MHFFKDCLRFAILKKLFILPNRPEFKLNMLHKLALSFSLYLALLTTFPTYLSRLVLLEKLNSKVKEIRRQGLKCGLMLYSPVSQRQVSLLYLWFQGFKSPWKFYKISFHFDEWQLCVKWDRYASLIIVIKTEFKILVTLLYHHVAKITPPRILFYVCVYIYFFWELVWLFDD